MLALPEGLEKSSNVLLVLATGAMGRPPTYKGEGELLGKGVSYCATCDGAFYRDSEVAVAGVNQEAIEEAQFLTKFAKTVHWITQTDPKADDALATTVGPPVSVRTATPFSAAAALSIAA